MPPVTKAQQNQQQQQQQQEDNNRGLPPRRPGQGGRRLFIVPLIIGSYFWIQYMFLEMRAVKRTKDGSWTQTLVLVPANVLYKLSQNPISAAAMVETLFLNLFGFLAIALILYKRGGSVGYVFSSFFTNSFLGLGLCNYLYPFTPLDTQAYLQLTDRVTDLDKSLKKTASPKKTPAIDPSKVPGQPLTTPSIGYFLFTIVAAGLLITPKFMWEPTIIVYVPLVYLAAPLALMALVPARTSENHVLRTGWVQFLLFTWLLIGIATAYHTRCDSASFPVSDLPFTQGKQELTRVFLSRFSPFHAEKQPDKAPPSRSRLNKTTLFPGYLGFVAQLYSFTAAVFLFSLLDSTGKVPMLIRVLLLPLYVVAPTVAVPLYFLLRNHEDTDFIEAEQRCKEAQVKKRK
ncbi:hypothetical protein DIPPA_27469 [Diplonema papillatum]|nr:hypothetical protein DIPPA_27469 [Diplonema papillatum]